MRNSNLQTTGNILVKKNGAKYFHNGQKWASMFSKCFHRHFEHQKSRLFKRLFDILYTIRTRLYYFIYGLKSAIFSPYLQVQFHQNQPFSHASTKNVFKNVFTEIVLRCYYIFRRVTALFKNMYDVAFTGNSIS